MAQVLDLISSRRLWLLSRCPHHGARALRPMVSRLWTRSHTAA